MSSIIIDLLIIVAIILVTVISAKKGFVRTVVGFVGIVAAIFISFTVSEPMAKITYDKFIEPKVISAVESENEKVTDQTADKIWKSLPQFITDNADRLGISKDGFTEVVNQNKNSKDAAQKVSANIIEPVTIGVLKTIYTALLLIILLFIVKILSKAINKLFSFSIVGKLNTALGGILGIAKGFLFAVVICELLTVIISITENGFWIFNNENIANTILFKFFTNIF